MTLEFDNEFERMKNYKVTQNQKGLIRFTGPYDREKDKSY
jgi:hypothetical protein